MVQGTKAYLQDKNGTNLLVGTDWSMVQNRPANLATTNQLPKLGLQQRDGITYSNGAYDWDHVNNGYNCTYRIADMGSGKIVELRIMFGVSHDIELPKVVEPDQNIQSWYPTGIDHVFIEQRGTVIGLDVWANNYPKDTMISYHNMYFTSL